MAEVIRYVDLDATPNRMISSPFDKVHLQWFASQWFGTDAEPALVGDAGTNSYTYIFDEAAPTSGNITAIEVYASSILTVKFCVFSKSGSDFTAQAGVQSIATAVGLNHFDAPGDFTQIPITAGWYIGFYNGEIYRNDVAGGDMWYVSGDQTGGTETYSSAGPYEFQIRAYITEAGGGGSIVPILLNQRRRRG